MRVHEIRSLLEQTYTALSGMVADPTLLHDRIRWLSMFDPLDDLKEDLLQGNGQSWPPTIRKVYVRVRTGLKEVFEILLGRGQEMPTATHQPDAYCINRLNEYRNRLRAAIARISPVDSPSSPM